MPLDKSTQERIASASNEKLIGMLDAPDDYLPEAIRYATDIIEVRGGEKEVRRLVVQERLNADKEAMCTNQVKDGAHKRQQKRHNRMEQTSRTPLDGNPAELSVTGFNISTALTIALVLISLVIANKSLSSVVTKITTWGWGPKVLFDIFGSSHSPIVLAVWLFIILAALQIFCFYPRLRIRSHVAVWFASGTALLYLAIISPLVSGKNSQHIEVAAFLTGILCIVYLIHSSWLILRRATVFMGTMPLIAVICGSFLALNATSEWEISQRWRWHDERLSLFFWFASLLVLVSIITAHRFAVRIQKKRVNSGDFISTALYLTVIPVISIISNHVALSLFDNYFIRNYNNRMLVFFCCLPVYTTIIGTFALIKQRRSVLKQATVHKSSRLACPSCGTMYNPNDYNLTASEWYCSACNTKLPK